MWPTCGRRGTWTNCASIAEQAIREKKTHVGYLEALLLAEVEERERSTIERRLRAAHLPRQKTLEEFDYTQSPNVTAAKMRDLAEGGYIDHAEPVLFIGECGMKCPAAGHAPHREKLQGAHLAVQARRRFEPVHLAFLAQGLGLRHERFAAVDAHLALTAPHISATT
jgi:hypothetical protein